MTALASLISSFAALLVPDPGNRTGCRQWITDARAADLPNVHPFTRGLDLDIQAATRGAHPALTTDAPKVSTQDQDDQKADVRTRWLRPATS